MKIGLRPNLLLLIVLLEIFPLLIQGHDEHDLECKVEAEASCYITDTREELKEFKGLKCKTFSHLYKIDKEKVEAGSYSGVISSTGYPQISVRYNWQMCNVNAEGNHRVKITPNATAAILRGVEQPINKSGSINQGHCRKYAVETYMDSELRFHSLSTKLNGFLRIGDKVYNTDDDRVSCNAYKHYKTRLKYSDDCKVEAYAKCYLLDSARKVTNVPCEGNIQKTSSDKCEDVPVRYEWKACNVEERDIRLRRSKSKIKMGGKEIDRVDAILPSQRCQLYFSDSVVNTCGTGKDFASIRIEGRGGDDKTCVAYSFVGVLLE